VGGRAESIAIRPLRAADLPAADRIMRVAFGTFVGLPDPASFMGDASYAKGRWQAQPDAAFVAEADGEIVGSNFATRWGSVGFFGPLSVRPDLWNAGIAKRLMAPVIECFARWQTAHAGLFTFAQSPKHVGLYQKFGFWPRSLVAILAKPVPRESPPATAIRFSSLPPEQRETALAACRGLTDAIFAGLDVSAEIRAVCAQDLGDTVLVRDGSELAAFAICHRGAGSEAGSGTCYVKFAAVRPGAEAAPRFDRLLAACEEYARSSGAARLVAGVNTARHEAYRHLLERGFRTEIQGVAMHRPNESGYGRPGVFVIDDWR
jgi:predicted N-acetyltransferase YhbS